MKTIDLSKETEPIKVIVGKESKLSLNVDYDNPGIGEVLITTKKDQLDLVPKSWEQFCKSNPTSFHEYYINEFGTICTYNKECGDNISLKVCEKRTATMHLNKGDAEAFLALIQLRRLWHEWVKVLGEATQESRVYIAWNRKLDRPYVGGIWGILPFQEKSHAEKFIECFPELLDRAKILL